MVVTDAARLNALAASLLGWSMLAMLIAGPVGFYVRRRRGHRLAPRLRLWVHRAGGLV
jgi:hypothetical protein